MNSNEIFEKEIIKILPLQKRIDNRNFFVRNKKLIIIISLILGE